jgi:hypothetical protein
MLPSLAGMTGTCHHVQLFSISMGFTHIFVWAGLEPWSSWS